MSKYTVIDFNYMSSGSKSKMINLDIKSNDDNSTLKNVTFVCGIENNDTIMDYTQNCNKNSLYNPETNTIIHNLYDIKDLCLKSNIRKINALSSSFDTYKSENYIDIYAPQLNYNPIDFVQIKNNVYCLTETMTNGPSYNNIYFDNNSNDDYIDTYYHREISNSALKTFIYNSNTDTELSNRYKSCVNLDGIEYNYMFEIPLNDQINDFDSGDIHADIFQTKNAYNAYYSMEMDTPKSLKNCRNYCGLGNGCGTLFLKYYDNVDYVGGITNYENDISTVYMEKDNSPKYNFQKIETITSINRFRNNIRHKSNLYSIEIRDSGLNNLNEESVKIKQDIKNNIREIVKKVTPVNTQLFDVFFSGV